VITRDTGMVGVGYRKQMRTWAYLYPNGVLVVDSYQKNDNWTGGLRGRILVICVDRGGNAHWISQVIYCPTRCSVPDPSCASYGRSNFQQSLPEPVGRLTGRLDVYQADDANFVDLRARIIDGIKATGQIADEIKKLLGSLF
jgi:hypothetical protein